MYKKYNFEDLIKIMEKLRSTSGCPWDKDQTHESLVKYLREETEELVENIENGKFEKELAEELGDILLQVIFHSQIASEEKRFDVHDVVDILSKKLIRRHPHVFGNEKATSKEEVTKIWKRIKKQEKNQE